MSHDPIDNCSSLSTVAGTAVVSLSRRPQGGLSTCRFCALFNFYLSVVQQGKYHPGHETTSSHMTSLTTIASLRRFQLSSARTPRSIKVASACVLTPNTRSERPTNTNFVPPISFQPVALCDSAIQSREMTRFGDFEPLCRNTPSYPWCNLFYREVLPLFFLRYRSTLFTYKIASTQRTCSSYRPLCQRSIRPGGGQPNVWYPTCRL